MSAAEDVIKQKESLLRKRASVTDRTLTFLSSVRLGVVLLCVLVALSMTGMLILQQNVQGFDAYYASLTPAEKVVFGRLGLFDIYHSWYFNSLLLVLSLNIILASMDRIGSAWSYISKPKTTATRPWLLARKHNSTVSFSAASNETALDRIESSLRSVGLKTVVTETPNGTIIFGQSGKWNRIGAYIVHVFLLTLFLGHFVANRTGFDADVRMIPGEVTDQIQMIDFELDKKIKYDVKLPFTLECTDIQQRLIDPNGSIDVTNTLDWRTQLRIDDPEYGLMEADVSLNSPMNYRGYRFFQAQTIPVGSARTMKLELSPVDGGEPVIADLKRNGSVTLENGTLIEYVQFLPDFTIGQDGKPDTKTGEYNNPVAILNVTPQGGEQQRVFAFSNKLPDNIPINAPKVGYKWRLKEFERSPLAHVLSIKYDPFSASFIAWYVGGFGLIGSLVFVFGFAHRRIWADVAKNEDGKYEVVLAGEANRNQAAFQDSFNKVAAKIADSEE